MMIEDAKKKNIPGPTAYNMAPVIGNVKLAAASGDKQEKVCGFIADAQRHCQGIPTTKADTNYKQVEKKHRMAVMWPESERQKKNGGRLSPAPKAKSPAPGDFHFNKPEESYKNTQLKPEEFNFGKEKLVCFAEVYSRRKSFVPGAGLYKFDNNTLNRISGSPRSLAMKRH
jgi:hypothetical protein